MRCVALIPLVVLLSAPVSGKIIIVDINGTGEFTEIQPAIDAAMDGNEVLVKAGEYVVVEPINFNRLHDPYDPGSLPMKNIVVRSEDGPDVTTIRMSETPVDPNRASVVIFESGETNASVLEGLTLTGGKTRGGGGGVHCEGSSPILTNCTIWGNEDIEAGGGVYCWDGSSPILTNCMISGNEAGEYGGGLSCWNSSPVLTNCTITGNSTMSGGGVSCQDTSFPILTDCTITGNRAEWGAGMSCRDTSSPILTNCTISENDAGEAGGGIVLSRSSPILTNCVITGNEALELGGGMSCWRSSPILTNCTISKNGTQETGGGLSFEDTSSPSLVNCIVWGNIGGSISVEEEAAPSLAYCCVQGEDVWPGTGNINDDPLFVDLGDYHLQPGSPAIDAGTSEGAPMADIEGAGRPCGAGVDIGAYEHGECPLPLLFLRGDVDGDGSIKLVDVIMTLMHIFGGDVWLSCQKSADCDDNGKVQLLDVLQLLMFVFVPGSQPPQDPFGHCGTDPTIDQLSCESFPLCE